MLPLHPSDLRCNLMYYMLTCAAKHFTYSRVLLRCISQREVGVPQLSRNVQFM